MTDKPHVLLISTDHWPNSLLGVNGHPAIQTPTLDTLARAGTRFTRGYSECPVCVPARKTLMTGTTTRTHKDRVFNDQQGLNGLPTIAQTFRDAGYQAYAVGKLHIHPQRSRIGFDDVLLGEEGRLQHGVVDDYELFLGDRGYAGQQFAHGMCNNDYLNRPWHLPEDCHVTNWSTQQMVRMIKRRDPTRPGFWYLAYCHPHPPLAPLQCYMDMYRDIDVDMPYCGEWAKQNERATVTPKGAPETGRAFYRRSDAFSTPSVLCPLHTYRPSITRRYWHFTGGRATEQYDSVVYLRPRRYARKSSNVGETALL